MAISRRALGIGLLATRDLLQSRLSIDAVLPMPNAPAMMALLDRLTA
jgi:hypothetical protein